MKKIILLITAFIAILSFNGCSGGYDNRDDNPYNLTTLFLVDERGNSYANIPYKCDSMRQWSQTKVNGEFSFIEPESCEFDFIGWNGTNLDDGYSDDVIYIVDYNNNGKNDIPYECSNFNVGATNTTFYDGINNGSFDYDIDDVCVFHL